MAASACTARGPYQSITVNQDYIGRYVVRRSIHRLVVLAAGVLGLLSASAGTAHALISFNHSEPLRVLPG